jgi:hypothetical protein
MLLVTKYCPVDRVPMCPALDHRGAEGSTVTAPSSTDPLPSGHEFACCLTHDVVGPRAPLRAMFAAARSGDRARLRELRHGRESAVERLAAVERELGVRSAFYVPATGPSVTRYLRARVAAWLGRTDARAPLWVDALDRAGTDTLRGIVDDGWEVGLLATRRASGDSDGLAAGKRTLKRTLGSEISGCRANGLRSTPTALWRRAAGAGFDYDASLGAGDVYGVQFGRRPLQPFRDGFAALPLTLPATALPAVDQRPTVAWQECCRLLDDAREAGAVMTLRWDPMRFDADARPAYRRLYRRVIRRALDLGAWVGPPRELFAARDRVTATVTTGDGTERRATEQATGAPETGPRPPSPPNTARSDPSARQDRESEVGGSSGS